ncbi:hypothetical protein GDO86_018613 [Hymenochirus boettgeri]|uniref:peptidyl-tRNA hydrolase n=1 Tax=Hymenochirus boettgeri TaxID=247094 RepID=A0A8T2ILR1_9PIPI|nr:hypothetical protein GDO86_018613 [Hymenochirus boettgeri]
MHKVVLEVTDELSLTTLAETLKQANIDHKLWMEQPENIAKRGLRRTLRRTSHKYLKKFKLLK